MDSLPFQPMEPLAARELPRDDRYVYQLKWDGIRLIAEVSGPNPRLWTKKGMEISLAFPEISSSLAGLRSEGLWLDGEAVVADASGCPSFPELLRRVRLKSSLKAHSYARNLPAVYAVFDCLRAGDRLLFGEPWRERDKMLREILSGYSGGGLALVETFFNGETLLEQVRSQGWEGVVAKLPEAPYLPGKTHRAWWKIKPEREGLFAVMGIAEKEGKARSLLLGWLDQQKNWVFAGRVGTGLNEEDRRNLVTGTLPIRQDYPSLPEGLKPERGERLQWFRPALTARVAFREWTPDGLLRHPKLVGFTTLPVEQAKGTVLDGD